MGLVALAKVKLRYGERLSWNLWRDSNSSLRMLGHASWIHFPDRPILIGRGGFLSINMPQCSISVGGGSLFKIGLHSPVLKDSTN